MMPRPPMITAELTRWSHDDEHYRVSGYVKDSTSELYRDHAWVTVTYSSFTHYPPGIHLQEHWLLGTVAGNYFLIYKSKMA